MLDSGIKRAGVGRSLLKLKEVLHALGPMASGLLGLSMQIAWIMSKLPHDQRT